MNAVQSLTLMLILAGVDPLMAQGSRSFEPALERSQGVRVRGGGAHENNNNLDSLGALINERLDLMDEVARYKWNSHSAIEDSSREQKVLDDVREQALAFGLPPLWVQHFFREQIEAAKLIQYQRFAMWRQEHRGAFPDTPDLSTRVRPRLDALTPELLKELAAHWAELAAGPVSVESIRTLNVAQHNPAAAALALLPLIDGSAQAQADSSFPTTPTPASTDPE